MTDKVVIFVTCGSEEEAGKIAQALVEEQLAACVNVTGPVRSIYRWKDEVSNDQELLLVIKTVRPLFDRVRRTVEKLHSYEVPEVICLPVIDGAPNYLNWLGGAVLGEQAPGPAPRPAGKSKLRPRKKKN